NQRVCSYSCSYLVLYRHTPHPVSSVFPYTTLFRSWTGRRASAWPGTCTTWIWHRNRSIARARVCTACCVSWACRLTSCSGIPPRSEEHTSELQSRFDLVCRLLLEKKK